MEEQLTKQFNRFSEQIAGLKAEIQDLQNKNASIQANYNAQSNSVSLL